MKYLVDPASALVKSSSEAPLDFSISGKMVVDVPSDLEIVNLTGTLANLILSKNNAILAQHPSMDNLFYDEHLDATGVSTSLSARFLTGVNKRTGMLPGGKIVTTIKTLTQNITRCYFHCSLFNLTHEPQDAFGDRPGPSRLLYEEVPVDSTTVDVDVMDSVGTTPIIAVAPESEQTLNLSSGTGIRISVSNLTSGILYLGDWILLYG